MAGETGLFCDEKRTFYPPRQRYNIPMLLHYNLTTFQLYNLTTFQQLSNK